MKKRVFSFIAVSLIIFVLLLSPVSASWFSNVVGWFKEKFGKKVLMSEDEEYFEDNSPVKEDEFQPQQIFKYLKIYKMS